MAGDDDIATGRAGDFLMISRSCNSSVLLSRYARAMLSRSFYVFTLPPRCYASATLLRPFCVVSVVLCTWSRCCYVRELGDGVRSCYVGPRERRETPKLTPKEQQGDNKSLHTYQYLPALLLVTHIAIRRRLLKVQELTRLPAGVISLFS